MTPALILTEIRQTERAIARAKALRTTLQDLAPDEMRKHLLCSSEAAISALSEHLSALRYRYRHGTTEARA